MGPAMVAAPRSARKGGQVHLLAPLQFPLLQSLFSLHDCPPSSFGRQPQLSQRPDGQSLSARHSAHLPVVVQSKG